MRCAVGVGIDDQGDTRLGGAHGVDVVEIESLWVSVDLQAFLEFARRLDHRSHIDFIGSPARNQSTCRVRYRVHIGVSECSHDPIGDLLSGLFLTEMDAGRDPIGLLEDFIGKIERAILEDIALDSFENPKKSCRILRES